MTFSVSFDRTRWERVKDFFFGIPLDALQSYIMRRRQRTNHWWVHHECRQRADEARVAECIAQLPENVWAHYESFAAKDVPI
jgi:hypothetical protein